MAGVNKVILIGNLGKDPEVRHLESGTVVANFPIATTEYYKDRNTGERKDITDWHNIVLWRGLAEVAEKYLKKGSQVYIEGKLKTRSWEREGITRYTTEVVGDNMTLLGGRPSQEGNTGHQQSQNNVQNSDTTAKNQDEATDASMTETDKATDDLPF